MSATIVTVIEPDGSVWLESIHDDALGAPFQRAKRSELTVKFQYGFDDRLEPVKMQIARYEGRALRTNGGRIHWIYVRVDS